MTTLLEVEQAEQKLNEYSKSPSVQQWNAENERLRQIERLTECIKWKLKEAEVPLKKSWADCWCFECEAIVPINGSFRDLAIKVYDLGWRVADMEFHIITCPSCQDKQRPESGYAEQWRSDSGGLL